MRSFRTAVSTDDQIRNGVRWARIKTGVGLGLRRGGKSRQYSASASNLESLPISRRRPRFALRPDAAATERKAVTYQF